MASASGEVIGFYRTTPVCGVPMRDEDKALAASSFRNPASVFLLVEAGKSGIGEARFCFWGEGELFDWPLMLFPFDAEELAVEEMRRRSSKNSPGSHTGLAPVAAAGDTKAGTPCGRGSVAAAARAAMPAAGTAGQSKRRVSKPPREGRRRWLVPVLATIVVVLLLAGGFLNFIYFKRVVNLPAVPPAEVARGEVKVPLGLAVERRGNDLRVSWNSSAPLIAKADFGMLLIRGSAVSRDVPLSAEELRAGSVMYSSLADQVRFQLNVVAGEQVAREFLTVLMPVAADGRPAPVITRSGNPDCACCLRPPSAPVSVRELRQFKPVENRGPATAASHHIEEPPTVAGTPAVNSAASLRVDPDTGIEPAAGCHAGAGYRTGADRFYGAESFTRGSAGFGLAGAPSGGNAPDTPVPAPPASWSVLEGHGGRGQRVGGRGGQCRESRGGGEARSASAITRCGSGRCPAMEVQAGTV